MKRGVLNVSSLEPISKETLVVVDLDNTLVYTNEYLKRKGFPVDIMDESELIRAYVEVGKDIAKTPINHRVLYFTTKALEKGLDLVVITARVSVPAEITIDQVRRIFNGKAPTTYISLDKGAVVNTLTDVKNKKRVIVVDDIHSTYKAIHELRSDLVVEYYRPEDVQ